MDAKKQAICNALRTFINSRSGLDRRDYGDARSYRSEQRSITKDRAHALTLLRAVELRDSISGDALHAAFRDAFSGRLSCEYADGRASLSYCTGQYYPTEYRRAACAVLASALWTYARENIAASRADDAPGTTYQHAGIGDALRAYFRREFGRGIASRWFS